MNEMRRLFVELLSFLDDLAVVHAGDAVGVGEDPVVVGDDDHGALRRDYKGGAGDINQMRPCELVS